MVEYDCEEAGETRHETRFYISSLRSNAEFMTKGNPPALWGVENGLHWVMDMVFRDDECRVRKDNSPANFTASPPYNTWQATCYDCQKEREACAPNATWNEDFSFNFITA